MGLYSWVVPYKRLFTMLLSGQYYFVIRNAWIFLALKYSLLQLILLYFQVWMMKTFQAYLPDKCHRTYSCVHCRAHLADHDDLISKVSYEPENVSLFSHLFLESICFKKKKKIHILYVLFTENFSNFSIYLYTLCAFI